MFKPVKLIPVLFVQRRELTETFQTQSGLPLEVPGKKDHKEEHLNTHNIKIKVTDMQTHTLEKHSYHRFRNFRHNTPLNSPSSIEKNNNIKLICLRYMNTYIYTYTYMYVY